ncbi:amino acid decarboxylase [Cytobacillus sp. FJAT-53684]|uniref:Amino acid decarboxylase n=1 Tax=Cytobacillus mangrovibacter TaxID=3299024 RepID=A0ABW6K577_9BACI
MIDVQLDGERAIIDVRGNIARGEHPKNEIFKYVKEAPVGTIIEIHVPFRAEPLIGALSSFGLNVTITELAPDHFRLMTVKLNEI